MDVAEGQTQRDQDTIRALRCEIDRLRKLVDYLSSSSQCSACRGSYRTNTRGVIYRHLSWAGRTFDMDSPTPVCPGSLQPPFRPDA